MNCQTHNHETSMFKILSLKKMIDSEQHVAIEK